MTKPPTCRRCGFPLEHSTGRTGLCARCLARDMREALVDPVEDPSDGAALPRMFGGYRLLDEIGRGGMGVVYRARQMALDRVVALKLLLGGAYSSEAMLARFKMEAAAAAALQHPNIVPVYDYGEWDGHPFYAMELIAGRDLATVCGGRPLETRRAAEILRELAAAVHYAHQRGIVHRDLKPSNVMIDENGRSRVTDFGLARRLDDAGGATVTGQMLGSPSYASPEQAAGVPQQVSIASDIYGLGALFYHLLTGRAPFSTATPTETLKLVIETDPVRPRLLNPSLPRDVETICLKCLAKEPAARYASANALAEDVQCFLEERPIRARPPSIAYRARKLVRRRWRALATGFIIAGLLGMGAAAWGRNLQAAAAARERRAQIEQIFDRTMQVADPGFSRGRSATLQDLLEETARWVPREFADDPKLEARIHAKIGETYAKLSMYGAAAPHLEAAWATRRRLLPEDHPDYLQSLRDLGVLRMWQMRYEESEDCLHRVIHTQERVRGSGAEETLQARGDLLFTLTVQLLLNPKFNPRLHPDLRQKLGDECFRLAQESYDLAKRRLGDEHPLTLDFEGGVAQGLLTRGTPAANEEAERILARSYRVCVRVLGPEHPTTLSAMVTWGSVLLLLNRNEEALRILQEDLPMAERALGADHQVTAWTMQQLEHALRRAGRTDEADELIPRYVKAWVRTYGPDNKWCLSFGFVKMHSLALTGHGDAVIRCAQELRRDYRDRIQLPPNHRAMALMDLVLADAWLAQKRLPEAERHLHDARDILLRQEAEVGDAPWELWFLYFEVGIYQQVVRKEYALAEQAYLTAYEGLKLEDVSRPASVAQAPDLHWPVQSSVLEWLPILYADWGQPAKAAEWQHKRDAYYQAHPDMSRPTPPAAPASAKTADNETGAGGEIRPATGPKPQ